MVGFSRDEIISFERLVDEFEDVVVKQAAEEAMLWQQVPNPDRRWWQIWKTKSVWVKREPESRALWAAKGSADSVNNVYGHFGRYELTQQIAPVRITYDKR